MGEIPASQVRPGNVVRQFYKTDFGLHLIEGEVTEVTKHKLTGGQEYVRIGLKEARCSDVQITARSGAYLYGREGMTMPTYAFGLMVDAPVRLLSVGPSISLPSEIDPDAIPLKSLWSWEPKDSSPLTLVRVVDYFENADGTWVKFVDTVTESEWALEPEAFLDQCKFVQLFEKGDSMAEIKEDVTQGSRWMYDSDPDDDGSDLVEVEVIKMEEDERVGPDELIWVTAKVVDSNITLAPMELDTFVRRIARI